jgi:hypothetical protein
VTSIVLHPAITSGQYTGSPVLLRPPWRWWHTRAYDNHEHGHLCAQQFTGDIWRPARQQPHEDRVTLTFGRDWEAVVLTDPPSMRFLTVEEWPDIAWGDPLRSTRMEPRRYMDVWVVWHECPGPDWHMAGDMSFRMSTCRPGDYRIDTCAGDHHELLRQREQQRRDFDHRFYGDPSRTLQWPLRPTIRDGRRMAIDLSDHSDVRCLQCRRYMPASDVSRALQLHLQDAYGGVLCDGCAHMLRRGHMTVNEIRLREGLPPLQPVADEVTVVPANPSYAPGGVVGGGGEQDPRCRPEQHVLDRIEELVNEQVTRTRSGYDHNINQEHCPVCGRNWHGLPGDGRFDVIAEGTPGAESYRPAGNGGAKGCPGAFADEDEIAAWRAKH